MEASIRPWFTTGVALVGATAIAVTPIAPLPTTTPVEQVRAATAAVSQQFELTALDLPYILTLPVVRQYLRNWAQNWAVYLAGLAKSGVGVAQSLLSIPSVTVEVIQELLTLNFVAAFDTFTTAVRDSVVAIGQPLLDSLIWRNQKFYAVQTALEAAIPLAWIDLANGFLTAGNVVATSFLQGTEDLIAAVLTFNLGNIIDAAVDGTVNFLGSLVDGGALIVDGIESAQAGIAEALATEPPPPPGLMSTTMADVSDVAALQNFSGDPITVAGGAQESAGEDAGEDLGGDGEELASRQEPAPEPLEKTGQGTTGGITPAEALEFEEERQAEADGAAPQPAEPGSQAGQNREPAAGAEQVVAEVAPETAEPDVADVPSEDAGENSDQSAETE